MSSMYKAGQRCALCLGYVEDDEWSVYDPYPMHADKGICARRIREQERERLVDEGWTPPNYTLFPGQSVKSTSANVEPSAAVYARAWDEVSEEVMAKVQDCEHLIAVAVREERERIAQALMGLETYHRFVDTDGHVSVKIHDQQEVREDAAKIARGGGVDE